MKTRHEPRLQNGHDFTSTSNREVALVCLSTSIPVTDPSRHEPASTEYIRVAADAELSQCSNFSVTGSLCLMLRRLCA